MSTRPPLTKRWTARGQAGLTLVELMVGVAIALIALLVVMTAVTTANQQYKTTASGSDAQTNGALASYTLERDLRMAGNGLYFPTSVTLASNVVCEIQAYDVAGGAGGNFGLSMAPVIINAQASGTPDSITIFYGNPSNGAAFPTASLNTYDSANPTSFPLNNGGISFGPGNLFVVAPVSNGASQTGDGRPDCFMGENLSAVNSSPLSATPNGTYSLVRGTATLTFSPRYNRSTGSPVTFTGGSAGTADMVFNLGNRPNRDAQNRLTCDIGDCAVNRTYGISGNQLTMTENLLAPSLRTAWPIADNIVMFKAQFGKDTDANDVVDTWDSTLTDGTTDANGDGSVGVGDELWSQWNRVRAIRFAIVARSQTRDPAVVTASPLTLLPATASAAAVTWTLTTEQRHYRYRVYQAVVPIRNRLWSQ